MAPPEGVASSVGVASSLGVGSVSSGSAKSDSSTSGSNEVGAGIVPAPAWLRAATSASAYARGNVLEPGGLQLREPVEGGRRRGRAEQADRRDDHRVDAHGGLRALHRAQLAGEERRPTTCRRRGRRRRARPSPVSGVVIGTATASRVGGTLSPGYQTTLVRSCATSAPSASTTRAPRARAPQA